MLGYLRKEIRTRLASISVGAELVIECKNTQTPFLLIGEDDSCRSLYGAGSPYVSFDPIPRDPPFHLKEGIRALLSDLAGSVSRETFIGRQLVRMSRQGGTWKADNNSIYDSIIYPLAKAAKARKQDNRYDPAVCMFREWEVPSIFFTFPILVVAGPVFTVDVAPDQDPNVREAHWATLMREMPGFDLDKEFFVDVVAFDHFDEYIDNRVTQVFNEAMECFNSRIHWYDPEWLSRTHGAPVGSTVFSEWLAYSRRPAEPQAPHDGQPVADTGPTS